MLGIIGSISLIMLGLTINRKQIVFLNIILALVSIIQYTLLNTHSAAFLSGYVLLYGLLTNLEEKFKKLQSKTYNGLVLLGAIIIYIVFNGVSMNIQLLALFGNILGLLSMLSLGNALSRKVTMTISTIVWITFQASVGAYGMLLGNSLMLITNIISLILLTKAYNNTKSFSNVKEPLDYVKTMIRENVLRENFMLK